VRIVLLTVGLPRSYYLDPTMTTNLSDPDMDKASQPRTGHGTASVIARLNELAQMEPSPMAEPAEESAIRETPSSGRTAATDPNLRPA
jgi:hypothetical protein